MTVEEIEKYKNDELQLQEHLDAIDVAQEELKTHINMKKELLNAKTRDEKLTALNKCQSLIKVSCEDYEITLPKIDNNLLNGSKIKLSKEAIAEIITALVTVVTRILVRIFEFIIALVKFIIKLIFKILADIAAILGYFLSGKYTPAKIDLSFESLSLEAGDEYSDKVIFLPALYLSKANKLDEVYSDYFTNISGILKQYIDLIRNSNNPDNFLDKLKIIKSNTSLTLNDKNNYITETDGCLVSFTNETPYIFGDIIKSTFLIIDTDTFKQEKVIFQPKESILGDIVKNLDTSLDKNKICKLLDNWSGELEAIAKSLEPLVKDTNAKKDQLLKELRNPKSNMTDQEGEELQRRSSTMVLASHILAFLLSNTIKGHAEFTKVLMTSMNK